MTAKWIVPLAVAIAIAAFVAGCGDSEDSNANNGSASNGGASNGNASDGEAATTTSLSKTEYLRKVDKICYNAKEEQALGLVKYGQENPGKIKSRLDAGPEAVQAVLLPSLRDMIAEVREVDPPKGVDEQKMETILDGLEKGADEIKAKGLSKDADLRRAFLPAGDIALKYRLPGCAYGH